MKAAIKEKISTLNVKKVFLKQNISKTNELMTSGMYQENLKTASPSDHLVPGSPSSLFYTSITCCTNGIDGTQLLGANHKSYKHNNNNKFSDNIGAISKRQNLSASISRKTLAASSNR